jgi:hypothetical protein
MEVFTDVIKVNERQIGKAAFAAKYGLRKTSCGYSDDSFYVDEASGAITVFEIYDKGEFIKLYGMISSGDAVRVGEPDPVPAGAEPAE